MKPYTAATGTCLLLHNASTAMENDICSYDKQHICLYCLTELCWYSSPSVTLYKTG